MEDQNHATGGVKSTSSRLEQELHQSTHMYSKRLVKTKIDILGEYDVTTFN